MSWNTSCAGSSRCPNSQHWLGSSGSHCSLRSRKHRRTRRRSGCHWTHHWKQTSIGTFVKPQKRDSLYLNLFFSLSYYLIIFQLLKVSKISIRNVCLCIFHPDRVSLLLCLRVTNLAELQVQELGQLQKLQVWEFELQVELNRQVYSWAKPVCYPP